MSDQQPPGTGTAGASPSGGVLAVEDAERVRLITFDRPRAANAFNNELYRAAAAALTAAAADEGVGAVVLTGRGRAFSAGTDLHEMAAMVPGGGVAGGGVDGANGADRPESGFPAFLDALAAFPKPLLAAVNGPGVGLGLTMLLHCDLVLVGEDARLLAPFAAMGVAPEAASSYLLPRRVGRQRAALALFTGEWMSAREAVEAGLALRVCPTAEVVAETVALARSIAARPLASLMATKRLMQDAEREGIVRARMNEDAAFAELLQGPRVQEAVLGQLGGAPT